MRSPRSEKDDDFDDEDPNLEALAASVSTGGGTEALNEPILEMICGAKKLSIMLGELDPAEYRTVARRLALLKVEVAGCVWTAVVEKPAVGFSVTETVG